MFNEISPKELDFNAFSAIGDQWFLLTAEKDGVSNTMTASWGGVGILWGKTVAFVFVRPQRYTKEFVDNSEKFSMSFLPEKYREELKYLGTVSGKDENKIEKAGLTLASADGTTYFEGSDKVFVCRKLYSQEQLPELFIDKSIIDKNYPKRDFHIMYVAEVEKVLIKGE